LLTRRKKTGPEQKQTQTEANSLSQIITYRQNGNQRGSHKHPSCTKQDHIHSELMTSFRRKVLSSVCNAKQKRLQHTHSYTKHIRRIPHSHTQDAPGNHHRPLWQGCRSTQFSLTHTHSTDRIFHAWAI